MEKEENTGLSLELDGHVYIVEKDEEGNEISRDEIDGEVVLQIVLLTLEESLDDFLRKELEKKKTEEVEEATT
jgi:hypothetical protein